MSEPVIEKLWIFQCYQVMYEPVDGTLFVLFQLLSGHVWTFWWNLLISPTLYGHVWTCYWNSLNIPNGQVMYEPIDRIIWLFPVFLGHVWTCWLNFPLYSSCHQVNVWTCCSNILCIFSNDVRSCLNLFISYTLNVPLLSFL